MITPETLDNWFTYHPPKNESDKQCYETIRHAARDFAQAVVNHTPPSADQSAAIRKIREAVATANMAVACGGK